ncbi:MAG TPA: Glu-tRNA(Gln) amidotransferase subunit GatD, partial [Methanocorpusculum sp.]|nr:Glu-tRNA(Gln) amidotransferase subunit GatD [Methanocorpusculum sp.]
MTFQKNCLVNVKFAGTNLHGIYLSDVPGGYVQIKLSSGYNITVPEYACEIDNSGSTELTHNSDQENKSIQSDSKSNLPILSIISTGGTISSSIDYKTGAVSSKFTAEDIIRSIPELKEIAQFRTKQPFNVLSENITPEMWQQLAQTIHDEINEGVNGVIVTHGTDTMIYSAAAISFMLDSTVPIIFVGAQRSADRPSSDNAMNVICSARAAISNLGEVVICMHSSLDDTQCSLHRATRTRKNHTSRRDAFQSIGIDPVGIVKYPDGRVSLTDNTTKRCNSCKLHIHKKLEPHCGLIQYYPGMDPSIFNSYYGYAGLVISGTGLGHVATNCIPNISNLIKKGTFVVMTSQCLAGSVCDRVYSTGRELLN